MLNLYEVAILAGARGAQKKGELALNAVRLVNDPRFADREALKAMDRLIDEGLLLVDHRTSVTFFISDEGRRQLQTATRELDVVRSQIRNQFFF